MRLLKFTAPGKLSLVQVPVHNDLPYAILSHTWTPGEEVTFHELITGTGQEKSGYKKIIFCGEQAAKDGFLYFWVDTCCIDKSNPVELQTAITSMYRWYQKAKKCYVYLADVSLDKTEDKINQNIWESAFRTSRWFTRGWTLQELLAPETVEFFSKEGNLLGDKKSLDSLIQEITRLPVEALRGDPFSSFSIAERRQWLVQRQTTEEEDIVYCLIGLCQVSMPLLYGEGKEKALRRLEQAVKEFVSDTGMHEAVDESEAPFFVPFARNENFTGRGTQLTEIENQLFRKDRGTGTRLAITGLGGVGKTQLALEIVYRTRDREPNCAVFWVPAISHEAIHQAYLSMAQQLCLPGCDEATTDVQKLVQEYLSNEGIAPWILVYDNADETEMWMTKPADPEKKRLVDYLPRSKRGCILFTTRDRRLAVKLAQKNVVEVAEMDEAMATDLLQKGLIDASLVSNQEETHTLLRELTCLPLAIIQATAYINENDLTLSEYLSLLSEQEADVISLLSEDFEVSSRYTDIKNAIATTWLISFERVRKCDSLAADYLSFMACMDSKDIPRTILPAGSSRKEEIEAIGTLTGYSFIVKRSGGQAFDLHRLVHLATRNWLRRQKEIDRWEAKATTRLKDVLSSSNSTDRSVWRTLLPHVQYVLHSRRDLEPDLLWHYAICIHWEGRYDEAEPLFHEVVERSKQVSGLDHFRTLERMDYLAINYSRQGRWDEATNLLLQVLETSSRALGTEHAMTMESMSQLANAYSEQGRWKEAEELSSKVISNSKKKLGDDHTFSLSSMGGLALTYVRQGRWKEAEDLAIYVVDTSKNVLGCEHTHTLTYIDNLAGIYADRGRFTEAEELFSQVVDSKKRLLGLEHPDTLLSMHNLAGLYFQRGRYQDAEELILQVLERRKELFGQEHPGTLNTMHVLAMGYIAQRRYREAEHLSVQVLQMRQKKFGPENPGTLNSIAGLAVIYYRQSRLEEAENLGMQALDERRRLLGPNHPETLESMNHLALIYRAQGRFQEALRLMEACFEQRAAAIGVNHPLTQSCRIVLDEWTKNCISNDLMDIET